MLTLHFQPGSETNFSQHSLCLVPQSPIYQLYATIVAFYLPLTVIIILNAQIYIIARGIISRVMSNFKQQHKAFEIVHFIGEEKSESFTSFLGCEPWGS